MPVANMLHFSLFNDGINKGILLCSLKKKCVYNVNDISSIICCSFCVRVTTNGVAAQTGILWIGGEVDSI